LARHCCRVLLETFARPKRWLLGVFLVPYLLHHHLMSICSRNQDRHILLSTREHKAGVSLIVTPKTKPTDIVPLCGHHPRRHIPREKLFSGRSEYEGIVCRTVRSPSLNTQLVFCSLQSRGISISDKGVSIKTSKRFDREDYVDATQRSALSRYFFCFSLM
jgi:hypothetical protein